MPFKFLLFLLVAGISCLSAEQKILPDADEIVVRGCKYIEKQADASLRFNRFDQKIGDLPFKEIGFNWQKAQATAGVRLFFKTDSAKVSLFFRMNPKDMNRGSDFGVFIDGKFHISYTFWKSHGNELKVDIDSGSSEMKHYEVTLPSFSNPHFVGMEIADGSTLGKIEQQPKLTYVALGDSITHGQGQKSSAYKTYPYLLAKKLNANYYNLAVGGGKISIPAAKQLKDWKKIDLMTILIGYNDWCFDGKSPADYKTKYRELLQVVRKNHPKTKIYCITLLYTKNKKSRKTGEEFKPAEYRAELEALVKELQQAGDKNLFLIKGDEITSEKNLQADRPSDPVHLSVEGARMLAEELHQRLK